MLLGLMFSYSGSSVIEGAIPTLVAVGMLSPVWIPLYTTLSRTINASAYIVARFLGHYSPYRVLLICEVYDMTITILVIFLLYEGSFSTLIVLMTYFILASFIPVITNIANGTYAGAMMLQSESTAVRFNAFSLSLLTLATMVIGRPLGSLLVDYSIYMVLLVNLFMTAISFVFRWAAMKRDTLFIPDQARYERTHHVSRVSLIEGVRYFGVQAFRLSASSPITTPLVYLSMGLFLYYLPLWLAEGADSKGEIVAMAGMFGGLGSMAGPLLFYAMKHRCSYRCHVALAMLMVAVDEILLIAMIRFFGNALSIPALSGYMALIFLLYLAASYCNVANLSARQKRYAGRRYPDMVGIAFSMASLAMLAGTWSGYMLDASANPAVALILSASITILGTAALAFRKLRHGSRSHAGR
ncbi:MFS transporter [Kushneria indalinina]|uniref:MFS transporter n=1 Tax=Kushneria indalinina DSM 14324 TaxID=1122140 RepID=A0A3D9DXM0_9GAMM|nr:MFS transporter [Kushneria indalinina]REC95044.1 hypothetical protein C8D72_1878 [Kushneria indalinina DSM 14324]